MTQWNPVWNPCISPFVWIKVPDFPTLLTPWNDTLVVSMYLVYSSHVITPLVNSFMYSYVMHRQVKGMVTLNLFIESH